MTTDRRLQPDPGSDLRSELLDAEALANFIGFPNEAAMRCQISSLPAPENVYQRKPYWSRETAEKLLEVRCCAIRSAFGHGQQEPEQ